MRLLRFLLVVAVAFAVGLIVGSALGSNDAPGTEAEGPSSATSEERGTVAAVIDGDTIELEDGERVRYLGIDTPEVGEQDCYAGEATARNRELVEGREVILVREGEDRDQFGRLLRWLWLDDGTFVNAQLVWGGHAQTLFFGESRFRQVLTQLQVGAQGAGAGGWTECGWR